MRNLRIFKELKKRTRYKSAEFLITAKKFVLTNEEFNSNYLFYLHSIFLDHCHGSLVRLSFVKLYNFCIITGRARGIFRLFKLSRLTLRDLAHSQKIIGLHKRVGF